MVRVRWTAEEVHGDYPPYFSKGPFTHHFTETEELILERAHSKMVEEFKEEAMMPRERTYRMLFPELEELPMDRACIATTGFHNLAPQILTSFAQAPPAITNHDCLNFPNLDLICQALWYVKFPSEAGTPYNTTFGEELMSRKWRYIEHGPPLVVEPYVKTKEDLEFFLDNMPDPALDGFWPAYLWEITQCTKLFPEMVWLGSCCSGPVTASGFLRGIREFLLDMRKNPEMATLTLKAATAFVMSKLDRMCERLKNTIGPSREALKNGNIAFFCDSVDYLRGDEFRKTMDTHYGHVISHLARKGWPLFMWPTSPPDHMDALATCLEENVNGALTVSTEHPPHEVGFEIARVKHKLAAWGAGGNEGTILNGPLEEIKKYQDRTIACTSKDSLPVYHMLLVPFAAADPATSLLNLEYSYKHFVEGTRKLLEKTGRLAKKG